MSQYYDAMPTHAISSIQISLLHLIPQYMTSAFHGRRSAVSEIVHHNTNEGDRSHCKIQAAVSDVWDVQALQEWAGADTNVIHDKEGGCRKADTVCGGFLNGYRLGARLEGAEANPHNGPCNEEHAAVH